MTFTLNDLTTLATAKRNRATSIAPDAHTIDVTTLRSDAPLITDHPLATFINDLSNARTVLANCTSYDDRMIVSDHASMYLDNDRKCFVLCLDAHDAKRAPRTSGHNVVTLTADRATLKRSDMRHAVNAFVSIAHVSIMLDRFASYLTHPVTAIAFTRSRAHDLTSNVIRYDHTHYSPVTLAHATACAVVILSDHNHDTYAPAFNACLDMLNASDHALTITCDAYPDSVRAPLA